MLLQKPLRLTVPRSRGETVSEHSERQRLLNGAEIPVPVGKEKLFADMLKRRARRVMADITECPPDTLPAHLARLDGLREVIHFAMRHELVPGAETRRSDRQLLYAYTLADFAACLEITKQTHRAPAFVNQRDEDLAAINRKLDLLAGLFAGSRALNSVLDESIAADAADEMGVAS